MTAKARKPKAERPRRKINVCKKGKAGEREFANLLKSFGVDARRGQQHRGDVDAPDVISDLGDMFHFEVKRVESLSVYKAMGQALADSGPNLWPAPVVAHRRNGKPWLAIMPMDLFISMAKLVQIFAQVAGLPAQGLPLEAMELEGPPGSKTARPAQGDAGGDLAEVPEYEPDDLADLLS